MQENHASTDNLRPISIDVRRTLVDTRVIRLRGGLLNAANAVVWRTVETELRRSPQLVVLDLSGVTDIDSAGIDVLVDAAGRAGEADIAFFLLGAYEGAVGTALAAADLTELFEMFPARTS